VETNFAKRAVALENALVLTGVWQKWRFIATQTDLWLKKTCTPHENYTKKSPPSPSAKTLGASVADDRTDIKLTIKRTTKCQRFVKLKELQAATQANAFAAHLILPNRTQAHPPPIQLTKY
jgi:hypothetical protein